MLNSSAAAVVGVTPLVHLAGHLAHGAVAAEENRAAVSRDAALNVVTGSEDRSHGNEPTRQVWSAAVLAHTFGEAAGEERRA